MIPVIYHGSIHQCHGRGYLVGASADGRYTIKTIYDETLSRVHRESFTILDDDLDNQIFEKQMAPLLDTR